jgi:hypothetical protein
MTKLELLRACGEMSILVMGVSFVVGSLTTIFVLVLLEMYRSYNTQSNPSSEE